MPANMDVPAASPEPASTPVALPAPAAPASPVAQLVTHEQPRRRVGGLGIAGIVVGSVLIMGALFGGGVAVGMHLPSDRGGFDVSEGGIRPHGESGPDGRHQSGQLGGGQNHGGQQGGQNPGGQQGGQNGTGPNGGPGGTGGPGSVIPTPGSTPTN